MSLEKQERRRQRKKSQQLHGEAHEARTRLLRAYPRLREPNDELERSEREEILLASAGTDELTRAQVLEPKTTLVEDADQKRRIVLNITRKELFSLMFYF